MSGRRIRSWKGLESYKSQIHKLARDVLESDNAVRRMFPFSIATGFICEAMRNPALAQCPEVSRAAKAQNDLFALHSTLVQEKRLDFDFVRREWATILDPGQEERELCDRLVNS